RLVGGRADPPPDAGGGRDGQADVEAPQGGRSSRQAVPGRSRPLRADSTQAAGAGRGAASGAARARASAGGVARGVPDGPGAESAVGRTAGRGGSTTAHVAPSGVWRTRPRPVVAAPSAARRRSPATAPRGEGLAGISLRVSRWQRS